MNGHRFPIESTHLLFFARAIGDPSADAIDYAVAPAPPTFAAAHVQFEPGFVLRPAPDRPWLGSGRTDSGADMSGFGSGLHAEQEFEYFRPLRAGMALRVETTPGPSWTKPRRAGGQLVFTEQVISYLDEADGSLVQRARQLAVEIDPDAQAPSTPAPPPAAAQPAPGVVDGSDHEPVAGLPELGATNELVVLDGVTRTQLVMYAGASGDYNPIHTDEIFATRVAGYPSVFAHGMLTMGASGRVLTQWLDVDLLRSYRVRFVGQVWPGDVLSASAVVEARTPTSATVSITTKTHDDRLVMSGRAELAARPGAR